MAVLSSYSFGQESNAPSKAFERVKFDAFCTDGDVMAKVLEKFGERAMLDLKSQRLLKGGTEVFDSILFSNPQKRSWTLVEKVADDVYCVVAAGAGMIPHGATPPAKKENNKDEKPKQNKQDLNKQS